MVGFQSWRQGDAVVVSEVLNAALAVEEDDCVMPWGEDGEYGGEVLARQLCGDGGYFGSDGVRSGHKLRSSRR